MNFKDTYYSNKNKISFEDIIKRELYESYESGEIEKIKHNLNKLNEILLLSLSILSDEDKVNLVNSLTSRYELE